MILKLSLIAYLLFFIVITIAVSRHKNEKH